jgi:hypothetical protein
LGVVVSRSADVEAAEDAPNTHNMLVFGEQAVFLSHLPMFGALNKTKTGFRSPHRYQVILEATCFLIASALPSSIATRGVAPALRNHSSITWRIVPPRS